MNFIVFSDFDGTITTTDILDNIISKYYSYQKYLEMEQSLILGNISYEQYLYDMFDNITFDLNEIPINIVDNTFHNFYNWITFNSIPF